MTLPKPPGSDEGGVSTQNDAQLEEVMREVPRGALVLAALTVGSLVVVWFLIYAFIFLPRGTVG